MELEDELGKKLFIRGKRKLSLTDDGIWLRRRAEELVELMDKMQNEMTTGEGIISGEVSIGGAAVVTILNAAAELRKTHGEVRFQFYGGDAIDVAERLDHGSLDFAVFLKPVDTLKYEYISLPDRARIGLLMPSDCPLAQKQAVSRDDFCASPLIFYRRPGLQRAISMWARTPVEHMNIAATYNALSGLSANFVKSGLGYYLTAEERLGATDESVCFRFLDPPLEMDYALVWKRYTVFSKAVQAFIKSVKALL